MGKDIASVTLGQDIENFLRNKYGYFDREAGEFVITRYNTPRPWANYITNGKLSGIVTHTGGGYSFYVTPRHHRITRWRYNALPPDRPGRYIYLRDKDTGEYWSPSWQPCFTPVKDYICRHGFNYTLIESEYNEIKSRLVYFVAPEDEVELWWVRLRNTSDTPRRFDIYSYVELCLGHALVDLINQPNDQHFNEVFFDTPNEVLIATKRYWTGFTQATVKQGNLPWPYKVFMGSSLRVVGFDGSKDVFIGRWRSEENPIAVELGKSFNTEITSGDAIFALRYDCELAPGEEIEFPIIVGIVPSNAPPDQIGKIIGTYRDINKVKEQFNLLKNQRDDYINALQTKLPHPVAEMMINFWNQYQVKITFQFSRDASLYHGGLLFGRGFRDSAQDSLGPLMTKPEWVRTRLIEMAKMQFQDGSTYHLYYPGIGGGERTEHLDNPLWLPFLGISYLKETGDFAVLEEECEFVDGGKSPLVEHFRRSIEFVFSNLSPRNLALFKGGDWNDTLDYCGKKGRGESVWMSMFLAYMLREFAHLFRHIGNPEESAYYSKWYDKIANAINSYAWDGEWYIRGTNDLGDVIGSNKCNEGKIFLNPQSWSVISGVATEERAIKAMDSVARLLSTPKGPKIVHPPYTKPNPNIGLITRCVPGKKENGAVFNHPVSWAIIAELLLGRGDRAWQYYKQALPMNPVIDIDRYEVEPYVYAEYVTSPDHPTFGQASHSWLTGSAAWMLHGFVAYLLGVRAELSGLLIDPCLPSEFRNYTVIRRFRGSVYEIQVENPEGISKGKLSITLDGEDYASNILPVFNDGKTHSVKVTLSAMD